LARLASIEPAESKRDLRKRTRSSGVCDNLFETVRNLLILNAERCPSGWRSTLGNRSSPAAL